MKYLIIATVGILFFSCSGKGNIKNDLAEQNLKGHVKSIMQLSFDAIEKNGKIESGKINSVDGFEYFDSSGNYISRGGGDYSPYWLYNYDKNMLRTISEYDPVDSNLLSKSIYSYDAQNNLQSVIDYDKNGNVKTNTSYSFDKNNRLLKKVILTRAEDDDTTIDEIVSQLMDTSTSKIPARFVRSSFQYKYDDKGRIIELRYEDTSKEMTLDKMTSNYKYIYNYIGGTNDKSEELMVKGNDTISKNSYEYNSKDLLVEEDLKSYTDHSYFDDNTNEFVVGSENRKTTYSYDNRANKINETRYLNDKLGYSLDYEYDKMGNWIKCISEINGKKLIIEREITYYGEKQKDSKFAQIIEKRKKQELRDKFCNNNMAEQNVKMWMNNNYPDWKINNDFNVTETDDCVYNVEFTAINPHLAALGMKESEVVIIQFSYAKDDFTRAYFNKIRGVLY